MREDRHMAGDVTRGYLNGLPADQQASLARVNDPGLAALRRYLGSGGAVAFLGAGASAPLYPLWDRLIRELVEGAAERLDAREAATLRARAGQSPEEVVEIVREKLGVARYREVLRQVLRARTDPESGRSWTPAQELVCRCAFKAVVTTNYDPGIVDARIRVRPGALETGFTTWQDELGLDQWRTGDVFGEAELPVLFAHGQHNRPDSVVLATTEYRRAYGGKLPHVLARLMDDHLAWIGFSFADQRITAILREIADRTGTRAEPGGAPRHVAVMAWDPDAEDNDPGTLARLAEIAFGAQVVLYPAPGGNHSALVTLLSALADSRFPPASDLPARTEPAVTVTDQSATADAVTLSVEWVPPAEKVEHFTGRVEELARLDRWAADPQVALVGVSAWGGAGKTALVTHWVTKAGGLSRRPGVRGVFGWDFYADPSAEHWADSLLKWAGRDLEVEVPKANRPASAVLQLLQALPLLLVLDGLEVAQEGPADGGFGRLMEGTLREVLVGACQEPHGGLVVLTSRFPFADLESFDGGSARMLEVPPFTPGEGSALLAAAGGRWLAENERRDLVRAVDGHALATGVLAGLLADRPPRHDLAALHANLAAATRTDTRVSRVLQFYAARLAEPDRYLLAAVSLFARPIDTTTVLAVAGHAVFGSSLAEWTPAMVQAAVRGRLSGLTSWHPDGTISAHPLVRDTFRPLVMDAAETAAETALTGMPAGKVVSRADGLRVVEVIELLLDADRWRPADDMYRARCGTGYVWLHLLAARLGHRAAAAFVATPDRRDACANHLSPRHLGSYLNAAGLFAMNAGDLTAAHTYLSLGTRHDRDARDMKNLAVGLQNLAACLGQLGETDPARASAAEALTCAESANDREGIRDSHAYAGWLASLVGDTAQAEEKFTAADQIEVTDHPAGAHLYSINATRWAEWLARTGRPGPAQALTRRNAEISRRNGWKEDVARCDRILGRLALATGDTATARDRLEAAAAEFRDGDYLTELATTLADLAEHSRAIGDLETAEQHAAEAITIAAPRGLVPAHCAALTARAKIRASQATAMADKDRLYQGRDMADAGLRLATRHNLPWHELDALRAHAALDEAEGIDRRWAVKADALHARLVPPGLDPDPLAAIVRLVAAQKAAGNRDRRNRWGRK
jgi:tetratricopeptide (TPR) repeat protein